MIGVDVGVGCGGERDGSRDVDREDNNKYINIKSLQSFFPGDLGSHPDV